MFLTFQYQIIVRNFGPLCQSLSKEGSSYSIEDLSKKEI